MTMAVGDAGGVKCKDRAGRRRDDHAQGAFPRERRRAPMQPQAAAQSVVMANLTNATPHDAHKAISNVQTAAEGYAAAKPQESVSEARRAAFMAEAAETQQRAHQAWVFERRRGSAPRATDIEDAETL